MDISEEPKMTTVEDLESALTSAFPDVVIDRAMIEEPSALWDVYDQYPDLAALDGITWRDLPSGFLFQHPSLLVYAGDALFRATLPAYLRYLLRERERFNALPFQVAGQLTRTDDPESHPKFDRRVAPFTSAQRITVRNVVAHLATVRPMEEPMSEALETWTHLQPRGDDHV
jgi:hypothetical protein